MTSPDALAARGALATAGAIRDGAITAAEVVERALDRIAAENAARHAFIAVMADEARAEAAFLDRLTALGVSRGPLHGVPVAIKDIVDVAGRRTRNGSVTADHLPAKADDAWLVKRLRAAGAIVVGKTHTVEYAFGGWGTNVVAGTPANPFDDKVHRAPGGSSSGSGVAVGAGLVPLAIGTDTGGSVRLPAAWCGCVGYKTTFGLIGRTGVTPLADAFDSIGPMTRTVRDAAFMAQVMLGSDPQDDSTRDQPGLDLVAALGRGVRGLTLGMLDLPADLGATPDVPAAIADAARALEAGGARLVDMALPQSFADYALACGDLIAAEAHARYGALAEADPCLMGAPVAVRIRAAAALTAGRLVAQRETMLARRRAALDAIEGVHALILPTVPFVAPPVAAVDETRLPGILTRFVNYLGWCGVSVPVRLSAEGLPIGLQVVARGGCDALALRIAAAVEEAAGGPLPLPRGR